MLDADVQAQTLQLHFQLTRAAFAGICEKQIAFFVLIQPVYKFLHAFDQTVSLIDHTVHIAQEAPFGPQFFNIHIDSPYKRFSYSYGYFTTEEARL